MPVFAKRKINILKQKNPPAYTQEAYSPPQSGYSLGFSVSHPNPVPGGEGYPHPVPKGGTNIQSNEGCPHAVQLGVPIQSYGGYQHPVPIERYFYSVPTLGGYPIQPQQGVPRPVPIGFPIQSDWGTSIQSDGGGR